MAFRVPSLSNSPRWVAMITRPRGWSTWVGVPLGREVQERPSPPASKASARPVEVQTTAAASLDAAAVHPTFADVAGFDPVGFTAPANTYTQLWLSNFPFPRLYSRAAAFRGLCTTYSKSCRCPCLPPCSKPTASRRPCTAPLQAK